MSYLLTAGDAIASCPGYVVHASGDYALDQLVPVAIAATPDVESGAFLCATVVGVDLPSDGESVEAIPFVMTKRAFRLRFTYAERLQCDAFNATFESNPALSDELKAAIRTGLADYAVAEEIDLNDPSVGQMLSMYEQLGLIEAGRAAVIGANA